MLTYVLVVVIQTPCDLDDPTALQEPIEYPDECEPGELAVISPIDEWDVLNHVFAYCGARTSPLCREEYVFTLNCLLIHR